MEWQHNSPQNLISKGGRPMARPSPSAQRIIAILNFFADHPDNAFSLTDLIRALKINRATCHGLLGELVDANYLYRTADKLYVLGPAIVRLGRAAEAQISPLQVALPEMRALADQYDAVCTAVFRDRGDVVIRERAASGSHLGWSLERGARLPLRPPFGAVFLAWSQPDEAEAWLDQLDPAPSLAERQRTRDGMAFARANGFQFVVRTRQQEAPLQSSEWLFIGDPSERPIQIGTDLAPDQTYGLASMSSPVFDEIGRVVFVLSLSGLSGARSGAEIAAIAQNLRDSCSRVSQYSAG